MEIGSEEPSVRSRFLSLLKAMSQQGQISLDQATRMIRALLDEEERATAFFGSALRSEPEQIEHEKHCRLSIADVEEYDFGWLFYYQSSIYLETGN